MNRKEIILVFLLFISLNVFSQNDNKICKKLKDKDCDTVITASDSNSYCWNNNTYYVSGTYYYYTKNVSGGDSISKLNLTIYNTKIYRTSEIDEVYKTTKIFKDSIDQLKDRLKSSLNPSDEDSLVADPLNLLKKGTYHALIIGVQDYENDDYDLEHPIKDAKALHDILVNNYSFDKVNVKLLENPNSENIEVELSNLSERLEEDDNVLIFYAGHGYWDEDFQQGYWLPVDANIGKRNTWVSNSLIQDYLRGMSAYARNVLLITDACFGGSIFNTKRDAFINNTKVIKDLYYTKSCQAMTSGTELQKVDDESKFLYYLVKRLHDNNNPYFSSEKLFGSLKQSVISHSKNDQIPKFGVVNQTNDDGGDFIFIRKFK